MRLPDEVLRFMPLFWNDAPVLHEAQRLALAIDHVLTADDPDAACEDVFFTVEIGGFRFVDAVRAGAAPAAVVEALAALHAVIAPRDEHRLDRVRALGWSLAPRTRPATGVEEMFLRQPHATAPVLVNDWGEHEARATDTDAADAVTTVPTAWREAVDRVVPLGLGGVSLKHLDRDRPVAWHNRHVSPVWAALAAFMDVIAGAHDELATVVAAATRRPDSPAVCWLAEMALRLADDRERAHAWAARVDVHLAAAAFATNARSLVCASDRRAAVAADAEAIGAAWRALAAHARVRRPALVDGLPGGLPARDPAIHQSAREGDPVAKVVALCDDLFLRDQVETGWERDSQGPFHGLCKVPTEVRRVLDRFIDEAMAGFRGLYGLELLGRAAPDLRRWLAATAD